jgi:RNA 2',3'-cyclic 3'-phosphodiesterase
MSTDSEPSTLRAFIALRIGEELQGALSDAQAKLRKAGAHVGWVSRENIHLTMAFLGDIAPATADLLSVGLDDIAARTAPFVYEVTGVGTFGGRRPKVIWAGVGDGDLAGLRALFSEIARLAADCGIRLEEREFHPHLTLGRVRSSRGAQELIDALDGLKATRFGHAAANGIFLMRSQLLPKGPIHTVLHEGPMRGGPAPAL